MARQAGFAVLGAAAVAALAIWTSPARADVIDGDWCADDGRHFSISGPDITTPGGIATQGNYARHSFTYVVPDGEEDAGQPVAMVLLNENTVQLQEGKDGPTETWLRCKPAIS